MSVNESPDKEAPEKLPPEIAAVLAKEAKVEPFVSAARDQAILAAAHAELELPEPGILRPQFGPGRWLAIAAAITLCFTIIYRSNQKFSEPAPANAMDFNGDDTVDILDVMLLAQRIEANDDIPAAGDVNQDGAIDQADVDAFASNLVRLDEPI
ncbi:MAG: dockerin type I domain-containing protein [Limisphaerales bacterium]